MKRSERFANGMNKNIMRSENENCQKKRPVRKLKSSKAFTS
jgi:hypothetical protein